MCSYITLRKLQPVHIFRFFILAQINKMDLILEKNLLMHFRMFLIWVREAHYFIVTTMQDIAGQRKDLSWMTNGVEFDLSDIA